MPGENSTTVTQENAVGEALADVLARTQVPLAVGLRWAASVSAKLQDMHQRDRRHGKVNPRNVRVLKDGLQLVQPTQDFWRECTPDRDVRGFGAMLYEIVTGMPAPETDAEPITQPACTVGDGLDEIRSAAIRLALKCMGCMKAKPNMRQAALEARLLWIQSRQIEVRAKTKAAAFPVEAPTSEVGSAALRSEVA
jgi:hypothetical protein